MEAGVLLDWDGKPIYWHLPKGRSVAYLPDSRDLWDVIWENRKNISGFAHSHPGSGLPSPSHTDLTTFSGIELAIGRRLDWWIISSDRVILARHISIIMGSLYKYKEEDKYNYPFNKIGDTWKLPWLYELRNNSYDVVKEVNLINELDVTTYYDFPDYENLNGIKAGELYVIGGPARKFTVNWSVEDNEYVGLCDRHPSLSYLAKSRAEALNGIIDLVMKEYANR